MQEINNTIKELHNQIKNLYKKAELAEIKPVYCLGQKFWVKRHYENSHEHFGFKMSPNTTLEGAFEEKEVIRIVICHLSDSSTSGCGLGENRIVVTYSTGYHRDSYSDNFLEEQVASSLDEAKERWRDDFEEWKAYQEKQIEDEKERKIADAKAVLAILN